MDRAGTKREIIQSAQDVESQQPIKRARNSNSNQGQAEPQQLTQQQPFQIVRYPDQLQVCYPKMPFKSKKWQNQARLLKNLNILLPRIFKNQNIWKKFQFLKGKFSFSSDIGLPSGFLTSFHIISSFNETCILSGTHYHVKMSWSTLQMTGSPINHQFRMKMSDMKHSKAVVLFKLRWEMLMEHRMEYNKF